VYGIRGVAGKAGQGSSSFMDLNLLLANTAQGPRACCVIYNTICTATQLR